MTEVIAGFDVHPDAELFPLMQGQAFDDFVEDIRVNGQLDPIIIDADRQIVDGRNRGRACDRLGIRPLTTPYTGEPDALLAFIISKNLQRRQLSDAQRAYVAAGIAQRQSGVGHVKVGHMADLPPSEDEIAQKMGVSTRSLRRGKTVLREGSPDLKQLVLDGGVPLASAARVATELDPEQQDEYVAKVKAGGDPVKSAPPAKNANRTKAERAPTPPKPGPRRKQLHVLDATFASLAGACIALAEITGLDESVTAEEATRLKGDLLQSLNILNRIKKLLQERSPS